MVEKKTVAIVVLCVTTILFLGLWSGANQEARTLGEKLGELEDSYDTLNAEHVKLTSDYSDLEAKKTELEDDYSTVKNDYDELNTLFEKGEAIAESSEWVTEDERLKITSKLITSRGRYYVSYRVNVTITNIGDEPIDKVIIFVFAYKDGKFTDMYGGLEYRSHTVGNIYIGETYSNVFDLHSSYIYSQDFTDEIISYKVIAVVG